MASQSALHKIRSLLMTALLCVSINASSQDAKQETVRTEMSKPLQTARVALQEKKFADALSALSEADSVTNKTPYEVFLINRLRAAAAAGSGDHALAATSLENMINSGRLTATEKTQFEESLVDVYVKLKDYKKVIPLAQKLMDATPPDSAKYADYRAVVLSSAVTIQDWPLTAKTLDAMIAEANLSKRVMPENLLRIRATAALRMSDSASYLKIIEQLATAYPTQVYWQDLISRTLDAKTFAQRHLIDLLRLKLALGYIVDANEYMTLADLALQAGFPIEADKAIKAGYNAGLLGKGGEAAKHAALRDKVAREAAEDAKSIAKSAKDAANIKDGPAVFNAGYNLFLNGESQSGLDMMEEGLKRPNLRNANDLRLRLGAAYAIGGQTERAKQRLAEATGTDGTAGLAKLWVLYMQRNTASAGKAASN